MKKRLLTLGALALAFSASAQFVSYVGNNSTVNVKTGALVYQGGGVKTVGTGKIDNSGNIMVVGTTASKFVTLAADNATLKTDGGNIIMRMTNDVIGSLRYGQLYIKGLTQNNITGIVDKEYKDVKHGTYQQIALPFYDKEISTLSAELGKTFNSSRWSQSEVLSWNNAKVRADIMPVGQKTTNGVAYYMLGSKDFDASIEKKIVKGIPYADGIAQILKDAGKDINFGSNGSARNYHTEAYNTYLQDAFDYSSGAWTNNFGRNIYQFGNPFLTNIDLGHLGKEIPNIQGIRVAPLGVVTGERGDTYSTGYEYITYTASGVSVGDNGAIIRPMQTFVVKLKDNNSEKTLNFDNLRRFAYTPRQEGVDYKVSALSAGKKEENLTVMSTRDTKFSALVSNTVKQLGVIALDAEGKEIGRTYYVVYADGTSGKPNDIITTQVTASSENIIGTFEEDKKGGVDMEQTASYWLYINEANENDFKGKEIPLRLYSNDIKSLRFEIKENASIIKDGQEKLSSGESFFISTGNKEDLLTLGNGQSILVSNVDAEFGLYYGKPESTQIDNLVSVNNVAKPSDTFVVFDTNNNNYKLIFDTTWKTANVQVFDLSGRLVLSRNNINTASNFVIDLQHSEKGVYVVTAVSETGHKFSQKIIK